MIDTTTAVCPGRDRISQHDNFRSADKRDARSQPTQWTTEPLKLYGIDRYPMTPSIFAVNYVLHGFIGTNSNHGSGLFGKAILLAPKHENDFAGTSLDETVHEISTLLTPVVTKLDQLEDTRAQILTS